MGRQFYTQLKAARDVLGLQFRFEVLLDSGREGLNLSPHFLRRVAKTQTSKESGCYSNGCHGDGDRGDGCRGDHVTYSDLENVPCVVVMTGEERAHTCLPRSVVVLHHTHIRNM